MRNFSRVNKNTIYLSLEAKIFNTYGEPGQRSWEWDENSITKLTLRAVRGTNYPIMETLCFPSCRSANYEKGFWGTSVLQGFLNTP